jgi:hypothetical protein
LGRLPRSSAQLLAQAGKQKKSFNVPKGSMLKITAFLFNKENRYHCALFNFTQDEKSQNSTVFDDSGCTCGIAQL